jgi:hypothetical protein
LLPQCPLLVQQKGMGCTFFWNSQEKWSDSICLRLCQLNKWIICQPYPMPSIHKLFKHFEGFTYFTALNLNMEFWTILLDKPSQCMCTIILPWGKYCYLCLPMGLARSLWQVLEWIPIMVDMVPLIIWLVLVALMKNFHWCQRIQQRQSYKLRVHRVNPQSPLKV